LARIITCLQRDLKKIVAYSRVTHITFILVGLLSDSKVIVFVVLLVSLAHGWASIGIFAFSGLLSHRSHSRLGAVVRVESSLHWGLIILGLLLISNASIPPIPSFFPEVTIVLSLLIRRGLSVIIFVRLSLIVCYYNAYFFI